MARDLQLRAELGFSTDPSLVIDLRTNPGRASKQMPEFPMTDEEATEFFVRQAMAADEQTIENALATGQSSDYYGGQFMDNLGGGKLVIQVKEQGRADAEQLLAGELAPKLVHPERVVVQTVAMSRRELLSAREQIAARIDTDGVGGVTSVEVSERDNNISVGVDPGIDDGNRARLSKLMGTSGVPYSIQVQAQFSDASGSFLDDSQVPPYAAGHGNASSNSTVSPLPPSAHAKGCTFGFKVDWTAHPSNSFALSAGHCWYEPGSYTAPVDSKAFYNWYSTNGGSRSAVGAMKGFYDTANFDLSIIQMTSATNPKIVVSTGGSDVWRTVSSGISYVAPGTVVCSIGAWTNTAPCGTMANWDDSDHQILANIAGVSYGDSGGPLYLPQADGRAWGAGITNESSGSQSRSTNIAMYLSTFCSSCGLSIG